MSILCEVDALSVPLERINPISLDELQAIAELQTRMDRKYLLPVATLETMLAELSDQFRVLEIDGRRTFSYRSVYFDTPQLAFFNQHLQGRRHRYKVRTRVYLDSGQCMLEVKSKGARSETIKQRAPHPLGECESLTGPAEAFVTSCLGGSARVSSLRPSLETHYRRTTLVHEGTASRMTCDVDLVCSLNGRERRGKPDEVLVETKSLAGAGPADRWLRSRGIRPHKVSKYCIGVALLYPEARSNPWRRTLRRHFGWEAAA